MRGDEQKPVNNRLIPMIEEFLRRLSMSRRRWEPQREYEWTFSPWLPRNGWFKSNKPASPL